MNASAVFVPTTADPVTGGSAHGSITEIIQHSDPVSLTPLLLPLLAQLSRQQRWLALVAPPAELTRASLQQAGVLLERVWILRPDPNHASLELACRALDARHLPHRGQLAQPQRRTRAGPAAAQCRTERLSGYRAAQSLNLTTPAWFRADAQPGSPAHQTTAAARSTDPHPRRDRD